MNVSQIVQRALDREVRFYSLVEGKDFLVAWSQWDEMLMVVTSGQHYQSRSQHQVPLFLFKGTLLPKDSSEASCRTFSQPPLQVKLLEGFRCLLKLVMQKGNSCPSFPWSTHVVLGVSAAFAQHEAYGNNVLRLEE